MFFYLSKLFWLVVQPINLIGILLVCAFGARLLGWHRTSSFSLGSALILLVLSAWTSLGSLILHPLEGRFERPDRPPANVAGIIVLGGGFEGSINLARGGYELNSAGDRFVEAAILARRYPDAPVIVSGGTGSLLLKGEADADSASRLLSALGVSPDRLILEGSSRNTYENAVFTREAVRPVAGQKWLLVTSAFHMPRSMALFRKAGFDVVPWPTDYRTTGKERPGLAEDNSHDSLQNLTTGLREWVGLLAYWITGRIDEPFPAP